MPVYDQIDNPLPIPAGYIPSSPTGPYEYVRLEETGYVSLVIEPTYGGIWLAPNGLDVGRATPRETVDALPLRSGTDDTTSLHDAKAVTLIVNVAPYLGVGLAYLKDLLVRWTLPRRRPTLVYKPRYADQRRVRLRSSDFSAPIESNLDDNSWQVQLGWIAPDGVELSGTVRTITVPSGGVATVVKQAGTADALPRIRLFGPLTNPEIFNDTLDASTPARLSLNGIINTGDYIELDAYNRTVQLNGFQDAASSRRGMLAETSWFPLAPGYNTLRLTADAGTGRADILIQDCWL